MTTATAPRPGRGGFTRSASLPVRLPNLRPRLTPRLAERQEPRPTDRFLGGPPLRAA